jgi:hypothetical protein
MSLLVVCSRARSLGPTHRSALQEVQRGSKREQGLHLLQGSTEKPGWQRMQVALVQSVQKLSNLVHMRREQSGPMRCTSQTHLPVT